MPVLKGLFSFYEVGGHAKKYGFKGGASRKNMVCKRGGSPKKLPLSILVTASVNIGPQCVQNRRSVGSSRKESKRAVRDCSFNNIQASVTASCSKSV